MTYLDLLKTLLPHGVYSDSDQSLNIADLTVIANALQACQDNADSLLTELFPDKTNILLPDWERVYGITDTSGTTSERIQNLLSVINTRSGISIAHIQAAVYPFVEYNVEIVEAMYFYTDDTRTQVNDGQKYAWDGDGFFDFEVIIDNNLVQTSSYDPAMVQAALDRAKPAHTIATLSIIN